MTRRIVNELAYVLHQRPYRETSALVELLTVEHGCVSVVGRGVRAGRRTAPGLHPFGRILVTCSGKSALLTLTHAESLDRHVLQGRALFSGLYLNELILRLVKHDDGHPALFVAYEEALAALAAGEEIESVLRRFEKALLRECGYGIDFEFDAETGRSIEPLRCYRFQPDVGFVGVAERADDRSVFSGATLLAIRDDGYHDADVRRAAKRLLRRALAPHLGDRPLNTRSLFGDHRR